MSEWKEVWYVWDGFGEKPKNIKGVLFSDGFSLIDDNPLGSCGLAWLNSYQYDSDWKYISAYTKGEKRRVCGECTGSGKSFEDDDVLGDTCQFCIGTGWEYKK